MLQATEKLRSCAEAKDAMELEKEDLQRQLQKITDEKKAMSMRLIQVCVHVCVRACVRLCMCVRGLAFMHARVHGSGVE